MKFLNYFHVNVVVLFLLFSTPALSSSDNDDLFSLSLKELLQVEVYTASQEIETAAESAAIITVITAKQLKEWGIISLHDVMSLAPGIVKSETYISQTTQTFRGVTPGIFNNKSLYLINGHPSYESLFGSTLLDYIPIELVERIEIVRSPASVLYGTNAVSGVINIITKQGADNKNLATFRVGSNSHGYGSIVHHSENLTMSASVQKDDGYNYSGTKDEVGNEVDLDYQYDLNNIFVDFYDNNWRINASIFDRNKAIYGINPLVWQNGIFETMVGYIDINNKQKIGSGELNFWLRYDYSDKDIHVDHFPGPTSQPATVINLVERYSVEVQYKNSITDNLKYIVGSSYEQQNSDPLLFISDIDGSTVTSAFPDSQDTDTIAVYSQFMYRMNDYINFIAGIRGEDNADNGLSKLMPKLGMTYQFKPNSYLKLLYSEAFRTPMFIEKYVSLGGVLFGDPDLERETIKTFEIGIESQIDDQNFIQAVVYSLKLEDEILRFPEASPSTATNYENGDGKVMHGIEFEWRSILSSQLELIANAAFVDGEDKSLKEDDAPLIANETANIIMTYQYNPNLSLSATMQHVGTKDVVNADTDIRSTLDSYQLFNIASVYRKQQHEIRLTLNNITDEEYSYPEPVRRKIDDVPGGPGRTAYLQYQYSF